MKQFPKLASWALARFAFATRIVNRTIKNLGWHEGCWVAFRQLSSSTTKRSVLVNGTTVQMRLGRGQSDLVTAIHVFSEAAYDLPLTDVRWIVDAGANVGYATLWFADRYPEARIIAIEPDASNLEMLRENTAELINVEIVAAALAANPGTAEIFAAGSPDATRVGPAGVGAGPVIGFADCVTIADLLDQFGIDRVSLLKLDIEGSELEVLEQSAEWIHRVDAIAVELHDRFRSGCTRAYVEATHEFSREFVRGENTFALR